MYKIGPLSLKTRVPALAWVLAGLVTLFSMGSSLMQIVTASDRRTSITEQATNPTKEDHQARVVDLLVMLGAL